MAVMTAAARLFSCSLLTVIAVLSVSLARVQATTAPDAAAAPADRMGESWWADRHRTVLAEVASHPDARLLLIGDSITQNYEKSKLPDENFQPIWQQFYAARGALNLGFSGDTTLNVLWRLDHGEVNGLHPKAVLLLIGTNDTGHAGRTADQTIRGVDAIVAELKQRLPAAKILLLGILPSDISDAKTAADRAINQALAVTYKSDPLVTYLDISPTFYDSQGLLNASIYYDPGLPQKGRPLHPDTVGQRKMAEAVEPTLARLMQDAPRSSAPIATVQPGK